MDKNCLDCFNFNDNTSTCKTMLQPPDDYFCFVPDIQEKLKQERDCLRYAIEYGSIHEIQKQTKNVITLMRATQ